MKITNETEALAAFDSLEEYWNKFFAAFSVIKNRCLIAAGWENKYRVHLSVVYALESHFGTICVPVDVTFDDDHEDLGRFYVPANIVFMDAAQLQSWSTDNLKIYNHK